MDRGNISLKGFKECKIYDRNKRIHAIGLGPEKMYSLLYVHYANYEYYKGVKKHIISNCIVMLRKNLMNRL